MHLVILSFDLKLISGIYLASYLISKLKNREHSLLTKYQTVEITENYF
jgi:hypothetical protein